MHGKRVGLHLKRRRMLCHNCKSTFFEPLADMDDKRQATKRLIEYIEKRMLYDTFVKVAGEVGVNEGTIRSIFNDYAARKKQAYHPVTPRWLGIDEAHLFHHYRCVLADVEKRTIIDLLENRAAQTVSNYLRRMPDRDRIEAVSMDMWQPYRDAVKTVLPGARIIIDKFHVVRYASDALEAVRKELRKNLTGRQRKTLMHDRFALLKRPDGLNAHEQLVLGHWLTYPPMKLAYNLKEGFYDIFDHSAGRQEAEHEYDAWLQRIAPEVKPYFETLTKAVDNWHEEIFSYFDFLSNSITNAYTESLNGLIKLANKNGRGYKFDVLRAKILFTEGMHKISYPKFNRHIGQAGDRMPSFFIAEHGDDYQIRDHGTDIYTLMQRMEDSSFFSDQL